MANTNNLIQAVNEVHNQLVNLNSCASISAGLLGQSASGISLSNFWLSSIDSRVSLVTNWLSSIDSRVSLVTNWLSSIDSRVSLVARDLAGVASTASLLNRNLALTQTSLDRPRLKQLVLTGIPQPVQPVGSDANNQGIRIRNLWITNGAATMAIGGGMRLAGSGPETLTMTNGFLILPNTQFAFNDFNYFLNDSSVSFAAVYACVASTSSGTRSCFMFNYLPVNII